MLLILTYVHTVQGYKLAAQLGHSIVKPVPSLFTFKIADFQLVELSGVILLLSISGYASDYLRNWEYLFFACLQHSFLKEEK